MTINVAWSDGKPLGDAEYIAAFLHVIMPVAYQFNPDLVLVSAGYDAAINDPLVSWGYFACLKRLNFNLILYFEREAIKLLRPDMRRCARCSCHLLMDE